MNHARRVVAALALLIFCGTALGNGVKMPKIGFAKMPEIPRQRALISYRNGIETLVVESAYITDSPEVGWILPIPAEPQSIEVADRDVLASVAMCMQPEVVHDLGRELEFGWLLFALAAACSIAVMASPKGGSWIIRGCVVCFLIVLGVSVLLPALNSSKGGTGPVAAGIDELSSQRVGNYQVTCLAAKDASALQAWLSKQGLIDVPAAGVSLIEDYVKQGWVFLVAKLARDQAGESAAHPLAVTFAASQPVFPMRLTSLAGTTAQVDLYVAADQAVSTDGFARKSVDQYHRVAGSDWMSEHYMAQKTRLIIGSPDAAKWLWPQCVVTHLSANLTPAQMNRDVWLTLAPMGKSWRETFYSSQGRRHASRLAVLLGGALLVCGLGFACRCRRRPSKLAVRVLAILVLIVCGAVAYAWSMYPVVQLASASDDIDDEIVWHRMALMVRDRRLRAIASGHVRPAEVRAALSPATLPAEDHRWLLNPLTGKPIREEKTPGNYLVREEDGKTILYLYDIDGRERRYDLQEER